LNKKILDISKKNAIQYNSKNFFRFPKTIIKNEIWAKLPQAARSIFPVIGVHCNAQGQCFPGEKTIARLSGRTEKIVRKGINALAELDCFHVNPYITKRGKRSKKFKLNLPRNFKEGAMFPFFRDIVDSGQWNKLTPCAQALYPVMRCFGFVDQYLLADIDPDFDTPMVNEDFKTQYAERKFDLFEGQKSVLCEFAGISSKSFKSAIYNLYLNKLVVYYSNDWWSGMLVFLRNSSELIR
jgi:hypothetical protein